MFDMLKQINARPSPFQFYTADELWTNEYTAKQMLKYHLDESVDAASRNANFINRSIEWIVSHFDVNHDTEMADFGCGPGLYTTPLAEHGARVTGIDFSSNSLAYARQVATEKALKIHYVLANYLDFETTQRFNLIIMIMCDFCALSPAQRKKLLAKFYAFLKPGGRVVLDVHSFNRFQQRKESASYEWIQSNGFWSPVEHYYFANTFKYENEKVALNKYTIVEKAQTRVIYNWFQHFSPTSITTEFEENGFSIEAFFADVAGTPFTSDAVDFAVVAKKI